MDKPLTLYYDNSGALANSKEPRNHKRGKHIERHLIREIVHRRYVNVVKIALKDNLADPFTQTLPKRVFNKHLLGREFRDMTHLLQGKWEIVRNMPFKLDVFIFFSILIKEVVICEFYYILFYYKMNAYKKSKICYIVII